MSSDERPHGMAAPCWCGRRILFANAQEKAAMIAEGSLSDPDDPHVVLTRPITPEASIL